MLIQVLLVKAGSGCWTFPNETKHRFEGSSYCAIWAVSLCAGYDVPLRNFHNEDLIQDTVIDVFFSKFGELILILIFYLKFRAAKNERKYN